MSEPTSPQAPSFPEPSADTVLITGGSGFIGSCALLELVPRFPATRFVNVDARTYAANPLSLKEIEEAPNYKFEPLDINDAAGVDELFERLRPALVLHLAAETHVDRSIVDPRRFFETNLLGTFNLLEAFRRLWSDSSDARFHHVSTDEVFGTLGPEGRFSETTPYEPRSPYSASKAASDHAVRAYHETYGLNVTITNCSNNYGPRQNPEKLLPLMIFNAIGGKPLPIYGDGLQVRDWLYVVDHVEAIWTVALKGRSGQTYCVGGDAERTNLDVLASLLDAISDQTGKDRAELQSQVHYVKDRPGHDRRYAIDFGKLNLELGWRPRESLSTGIGKTVEWYLHHSDWLEAARSGAYEAWVRRQYVEGGRL